MNESRLSSSGIPKPTAAVKGTAKPTNSVAPMPVVKPNVEEKLEKPVFVFEEPKDWKNTTEKVSKNVSTKYLFLAGDGRAWCETFQFVTCRTLAIRKEEGVVYQDLKKGRRQKWNSLQSDLFCHNLKFVFCVVIFFFLLLFDFWRYDDFLIFHKTREFRKKFWDLKVTDRSPSFSSSRVVFKFFSLYFS